MGKRDRSSDDIVDAELSDDFVEKEEDEWGGECFIEEEQEELPAIADSDDEEQEKPEPKRQSLSKTLPKRAKPSSSLSAYRE